MSLQTSLLKAVSRSFYLTLRVLPAQIRPQFGLAYLLARATDTIADTEIVPPSERLLALKELRERILGTRTAPLDFREFANALSKITNPDPPANGSNAERLLLERIEEILGAVSNLSDDDQQRIREVLTIITGGQELDLQRFGAASERKIIALQSDAELDDYTYRVAGCVGEYWTKMCRAHLFPRAPLDDGWLLANGVRFGKGLQLVNILRDVPRDLRQGRCYFPEPELNQLGLAPGDLLNPGAERTFRPLYDRWLEEADAHLRAGWNYTLALPRTAVRVRLACAWPLLIGVKTVSSLRVGNVLDGARRIKVSRGVVWRIIARSVALYPARGAWDTLFDSARGESPRV